MIKKNREKLGGQAMMTATIFFVVVSLTIILGLAGPVLRQGRIVSDLFRSRESYFLAEAGMEDVVYRLQNRLPVSSSNQTLDIDGNTVTTDTTDISGGKIITAIADWNGYIRKVETRLVKGVGVAFNYGVQTGNGGLILSPNAGIEGNVYSNGNITGGNASFVTGSAFAANSIPLTTDQSNMTPLTPTNWIDFRNTSATSDVAQKFQVSTESPVSKAQFYLKKTGNPSNATVRIVTDNNGSPDTNVLTTGTLSASLITTNYGVVDVVFSSTPTLSTETDYWIVVDTSNPSTSNYYTIAANTSYALGDAKIGQYGSSWNATTPASLDMYFSISLGGLFANIDGVEIGEGGVGDGWAHIVTNSIIAGKLSCQTGSGNNKACDTSSADPSPQPYPISEGNINQWKAEAEMGGVISGDYTVDGTVATIGPKKITGNLTIKNSADVTLTGALWVEGEISVFNNANVKLSSSYGSDSGIIIADDIISIYNNAQFAGSGQSGTYILLLTTSDCPTGGTCGGENAIEVGNNAGAVILNAQSGVLQFSNNAGAKEATAETISLQNGAIIVYDSGLANLNFVTGPSGGWNIDTWKEVE